MFWNAYIHFRPSFSMADYDFGCYAVSEYKCNKNICYLKNSNLFVAKLHFGKFFLVAAGRLHSSYSQTIFFYLPPECLIMGKLCARISKAYTYRLGVSPSQNKSYDVSPNKILKGPKFALKRTSNWSHGKPFHHTGCQTIHEHLRWNHLFTWEYAKNLLCREWP